MWGRQGIDLLEDHYQTWSSPLSTFLTSNLPCLYLPKRSRGEIQAWDESLQLFLFPLTSCLQPQDVGCKWVHFLHMRELHFASYHASECLPCHFTNMQSQMSQSYFSSNGDAFPIKVSCQQVCGGSLSLQSKQPAFEVQWLERPDYSSQIWLPVKIF